MRPLPQLIYIAGYGRSGSTVLGCMLGAIPHALNCGELTYLFDEAMVPDRSCACGVDYHHCPIWGPILAKTKSRRVADEVIRGIDGRAGWQHGSSRPNAGQYRVINRQLFTQISAQGYQYVIDSSKTAGHACHRPAALRTLLGLDVKLIHLVRSPVAVWQSVRHGSNWAMDGYRYRRAARLRAIPGWILANHAARAARRAVGPNNYLLLHFEELVHHPAVAIKRLQDFLKVDLHFLATAIANQTPFSVGHNIGGNRLRNQGQFRFKSPSH